LTSVICAWKKKSGPRPRRRSDKVPDLLATLSKHESNAPANGSGADSEEEEDSDYDPKGSGSEDEAVHESEAETKAEEVLDGDTDAMDVIEENVLPTDGDGDTEA